jgi:hypothetical protein
VKVGGEGATNLTKFFAQPARKKKKKKKKSGKKKKINDRIGIGAHPRGWARSTR